MATKKKNRLDDIFKKVIQQKEKQFKALKARYQELLQENSELMDAIRKLEAYGIDFGTPSWKTQTTTKDGGQKQYLRILSMNGGNKYVGCKPEKVEKALADIERGKEHATRKRMLESNLNEMEDIISEIEQL